MTSHSFSFSIGAVSAPTPLSLAETHEIAQGLLRGWKNTSPKEKFELRQGVHLGQFAVVYAMAAHAHRLGNAVLTLYRAEMYLESIPTIRCTYEHGLRCMWGAQYPTAAAALFNEGYTNRKKMAKSARAGWGIVIELAEEAEGWEPLPSTLNFTAKNFEAMCKALQPGEDEAYLLYRLMSSMSHPGPHLTNCYLKDDPVTVQDDPKPIDCPETWLFILCCSLVWAGSAVDMLHEEHSRRNELRAVATKLGIPSELKARKDDLL